MLIPDNTVPLEKPDLKAGEIQFFDCILPTLAAGEYVLRTEQTLQDDGLEQHFARSQKFIVEAPRFRLGVGDVYSIYPPADGQGDFENVLPQVVFRNPSLPWERSDSDDGKTPWLAILVFEPEELLVEDWSKTTRTGAKTSTIASIKHPENGYLQPVLKDLPTDEDGERCLTIEISAAHFNQIAPKWEELPYLAHVRAVNTDDKEALGTTGWFSTVFANRLPKTPHPGEPNARNIAHLVSLEGFGHFLKSRGEPIDNTLKVRLVSLASWEFYCEAPKEEFEVLMTQLLNNQDVLRIPVEKEPTNDTEIYLKNALDGGYVPLNYSLRQGEQTLAWYKAPLTPTINLRQHFPPSFSAESAMIYDTERGIFDVSYASAWQIGRLLGLSDAFFAQSLMAWKRQANLFLDKFFAKKNFFQNIVKVMNDTAETEDQMLSMDDLMAADAPDKMLTQLLKQALSEMGLSSRGDLGGTRSLEELIDKAKMELDGLDGILSSEQFDELMKTGEDLHLGLLKTLFPVL